MTRILLTAFTPFGGCADNSSLAALDAPELLSNRSDIVIFTKILPVVYGSCADILEAMLADSAQGDPFDAVICFGQAAGRSAVSLELRAVNRVSSPQPDEAGVILTDQAVVEGGAEELASALPCSELAAALHREKIRAELSDSAGEYVCNYLFYRLLSYRAAASYPRFAGFIHVPSLSDGMTRAAVTRAAAAICSFISNIISGDTNGDTNDITNDMLRRL